MRQLWKMFFFLFLLLFNILSSLFGAKPQRMKLREFYTERKCTCFFVDRKVLIMLSNCDERNTLKLKRWKGWRDWALHEAALRENVPKKQKNNKDQTGKKKLKYKHENEEMLCKHVWSLWRNDTINLSL